jgi:protein tyrosine phosphatase (PTP) superfamily phosphohydrolase (DUF442 family)
MKWLTNWLIVRGCNLLYPHAFYYSVRGPRVDERPPDVGPNSPWWGEYRPFADSVSRLCWLNTDSTHVCEIAILGLNDYLPWEAAKVCFQNQRDFNYLEARHLWEDAEIDEDGIHIAGMHYAALIVEIDPPAKATPALEILEKAGRLIRWNKNEGQAALMANISRLTGPDIELTPVSPDLRVRHVVKEGAHFYILFNEGQSELSTKLKTSETGLALLLDPQKEAAEQFESQGSLTLKPHELRVLMITSQGARNPKWAKKLTLEGVGNFYKISDILYRSEQPTATGMKNLEKMGIKTIVNLRSFHSDRGEMRGTKMGYEHITMKAWHAEDKEVVRFLKIVTNKKNQPVLVHCQHGADRTGTMCALYRVAIEGWTKDEAIEEMTKGGYGYHTIWKNLITYIRELDIEKIKQKAGLE